MTHEGIEKKVQNYVHRSIAQSPTRFVANPKKSLSIKNLTSGFILAVSTNKFLSITDFMISVFYEPNLATIV